MHSPLCRRRIDSSSQLFKVLSDIISIFRRDTHLGHCSTGMYLLGVLDPKRKMLRRVRKVPAM